MKAAQEAAEYELEKQQMNEQRREAAVQKQMAELSQSPGAKAAKQCPDAPSVSVEILKDKRWSPPEGYHNEY